MRNIRTFCIAFYLFMVVCCACASEITPANVDDGIELRWRRHSKKSESTSESVKKQKQQQQQQEDSEAITRSQLARSPSYAGNTPIGLATLGNNVVDPMRNVLQNVPLQMRQMDNPFNAGGVPNYAYNYPYQGYPSQPQASMANPGYLYGNPNMAFNGGVQPLDQAPNNNLIGQQSMPDFINGQQSFPNGYGTNFMGYGPGQPGVPQQGLLTGQQPFPPAYGNQLMGYGSYPLGQPGLQNNFGSMSPSGLPNIFGQQGPLPGMPPMNGNNFMGLGPIQPGDPSAAGHLTQLSQPSMLNPLLGMVPFGVPPQNGVNNGFGLPGGLFPDFIRQQRSAEEVNEE